MAHDTHHHNEGKKAVFGPPVIMGLAFWLFAFFFLSLCDGKKGHDAHEAGAEHGAAKTEQVEPKKSEEAAVTTTEEVKAPADSVKKEEAAH